MSIVYAVALFIFKVEKMKFGITLIDQILSHGVSNDWILATGFWDDTKLWVDTSTWID